MAQSLTQDGIRRISGSTPPTDIACKGVEVRDKTCPFPRS